MGLRFQVRIDGHKDLRTAIRKTQSKDIAKGLREAHKATAAVVVPPARRDAPRRSGALSASVKPSSSVKGAIVRAGSARVRYAGPIHFGWPARGIEPRFFLFDAAGETKDAYSAVFRERMNALVHKNINSN
ncbi:hypothetical protein NLX83_13110 [Allokutzneria sp. A3M-2-11 16]|uniref:hypothetical protein n=1 Tax=Allokutzneria sp. A3M-2-11 16 TaxID=2962043 RepID=UPI0020B741DF|nr:hypothetical protein [Allokutzneria sp. A3M-2-11 16]MCP3800198.1 hypothetical protein [Allokutzneria sp. A3M-2-11 16]